MHRASLLLAVTLFFAACTNTNSAEPVPARLVDPSDADRAALKTALASLLNQDDVLLAGDAFIDESVMTLERQAHRDAQGNRIQGRELGMPTRVQLLLDHGRCVLKHLGNNNTMVIPGVQCKPEATDRGR